MQAGRAWLRAGYWVPAVADFGIAALVLSPERMGTAAYVYPMGLMAAVAFSWGVMLIVAGRRPEERRWVLPPTMLVVALLGGVGLHAGASALISPIRAAATAGASAVVLAVVAISYRIGARK